MREIAVSTLPIDLNFDILKIKDINFDILLLQSITADVLSKYQLKKKDHYQKYSGIGLQYNDALDPYYDSLNAQRRFNADGTLLRTPLTHFGKLNDIAMCYKFILDQFIKVNITLLRGRLLVLEPGCALEMHRDRPELRLHIPITTAPECIMIYQNASYHLPADGSCYLTNVDILHSAKNESMIDRCHLLFDFHHGLK